MKRLHLILVVLIAIAIGFVSHGLRHSEGSEQESVESKFSPSKSRNGALLARRSAEIRSLTKGVSLEGGQEEWFRWLAYLENARAADLPQFVASVGNNAMALRLIAERWVAIDPEDGLRYLLTRRGEDDFKYRDSAGSLFSKLFFAKWTQLDLEAVVVALDRPEVLPGLDDFRQRLVHEMFERDPRRALALGSRWKAFHRSPRLSTSLREWIQKDPSAAAQAIFALPSSGFLKPLAEFWGERDPKAALDFAFQKGGDRGYQFAEVVFKKWSQEDLSAASQKLSELSEAEANFLTPILVESWSKSDPEAALDWSQQSLTGRLRNDSIERVVLASAFSKRASPRDLLAQIESPEAYHQAVVGLSHKLWGQNYNKSPKYREAITWFDDVNEPRTFDKIFPEFSSFLANYDFEQFQELMKSPRAQTVSERSFTYGMDAYASYGEPEEAMDVILEVPSAYLPKSSASVFSSWYGKEPEAAAAWAEDLAANDPRRSHLVEGMDRFLVDSHEQTVASAQFSAANSEESFS